MGGYVNAQPFKGRVKNVNQFADYKIKIVDTNEDFLIKIVNLTPFNNYEWQFVDWFPEDGVMRFITNLVDPTTDDTQRWFSHGDQIRVSTNDQETVVFPIKIAVREALFLRLSGGLLFTLR